MSARASLTVGLMIAALAFGGWRMVAPQRDRATEAAGESVDAIIGTVAWASFTGAEASLAAQKSATGSYAGARLQPPIRLVRADESAYCIQLERAPLLQHLVGPGGTPAPGPCG